MNQARIDEMYKVIQGLSVDLEVDPTILGPRYILERVATCRNNINTVSLIRQEISRERRSLQRELSAEKATFSVEQDQLLATDETVKRAPSIRDRQAMVNTLLRSRLNRIAHLEAEILDLTTVEQPIKMVHEELVRTASEIRTQRSMIQADRLSGAGFGDESGLPGQNVTPAGLVDDIDEAALDQLMSEETKSASHVEVPTPVRVEVPTTEEVTTSLEMKEAVKVTASDIELEMVETESSEDSEGSEVNPTFISDYLQDFQGDSSSDLPVSASDVSIPEVVLDSPQEEPESPVVDIPMVETPEDPPVVETPVVVSSEAEDPDMALFMKATEKVAVVGGEGGSTKLFTPGGRMRGKAGPG